MNSFISREFLAALTESPGIYQMQDGSNVILYIGKARNLKKRVSQYFQKKNLSPRLTALVSQIQHIELIVTQNENEALLLENQLIKKYQPKYNVLLRDDKSYPYILLSKQPYPRLHYRRGAPQAKKEFSFGPYPSITAVRETLKLMQKIFKLRTCSDSFFKNRVRPCLLYQLEKCSAPCVNKISPENYAHDIESAKMFLNKKNTVILKFLKNKMQDSANAQYYELAAALRDQIKHIEHIQTPQGIITQKGDSDVLAVISERNITAIILLFIRSGTVSHHQLFYPEFPPDITFTELLIEFIAQYYIEHKNTPKKIIYINQKITLNSEEMYWLENTLGLKIKTVLRGKNLNWIKMAHETGLQAIRTKRVSQDRYYARLKLIQAIFKLKKIPERLECFDISHHQGEATVASCVVFNAAGPAKKEYRQFNIKDITAGDDYAAIYQVVLRRYLKNPLPDIIFIDGGKGQLSQAEKVFKVLNIDIHPEKTILAAVSKGMYRKPGEEQIWLSGHKNPLILPPDSEALHLIQYIRDESHRFALMAHRRKKSKIL